MGSIQPGEAVESPKQTLLEESSSSDSLETIDPFGDPLINLRVGNEYQVEIPSQLTEFELLQYLKNPAEEPDVIPDACHTFLIGQPIPITWIHCEPKPIKNEASKCHDSPNGKLHSNGSIETQSATLCNDSLFQEDPDSNSKDPCCPVPGLSAESWTEFEVECFLLGLYIFGKNLIQVAKFVESKDVGQALLFFYGKFYRTSRYCRWLDCRKMKRRKSIVGSRFFTGCRQQELLSRLLPNQPEESKITLQQISRYFADGRIELEEYISDLKSLVGLRALVDAVGIGSKEDLTTLVSDSSRGGQTSLSHLKVPSGEAFSSLSCSGIVKLLSGDTRLTKAKSNDLFWAAVWPRLLARGWHSELPKGDGHLGSKNDLVFLIPGVKKFSKRKLRRREHYFDVVTDVLKKVASKPELLLLEGEDNELVKPSKVDNGCVPEEKSDDDDQERRCYLQPRVSNATEDMMFTVVDTSFHCKGKPYVKRESRSLPVETKCLSLLDIEENAVDSTGHSGIDSASTDLQVTTHNKDLSNVGGLQLSLSVLNEKPSSPLVDGKPSKMKRRLSRENMSDKPIVKKKRNLASGSRPDAPKRVPPWASAEIKREPFCILSLPVVDEKTAKKAKRRQLKIQQEAEKELGARSSCLQQDLGNESGFHNFLSPDTNLSEITDEEGQKMKHSFDLNLPPESPAELGLNDKSPVEEEGNILEPNSTRPDITLSLNQAEVQESCLVPAKDPEKDAAETDDTGPGKRNRPMSTKALEALESYLLNPTPKKKRSSLVGSEGEKRKHSRRSRKITFDDPIETETADKAEVISASPLLETSDKEGDRAETPA